MRRSPLALLVAGVLVAGCGDQPTPPASTTSAAAAMAARQPSDQQLLQTARRWLTSYLRVEVAVGTARDLQQLYTLSTRPLAYLVSQAPRPTNTGFPPAGTLRRLTLLPSLTPGRYTAQGDVARGQAHELWAVELIATRRGPLVRAFRTSTPPRPPRRTAGRRT